MHSKGCLMPVKKVLRRPLLVAAGCHNVRLFVSRVHASAESEACPPVLQVLQARCDGCSHVSPRCRCPVLAIRHRRFPRCTWTSPRRRCREFPLAPSWRCSSRSPTLPSSRASVLLQAAPISAAREPSSAQLRAARARWTRRTLRAASPRPVPMSRHSSALRDASRPTA